MSQLTCELTERERGLSHMSVLLIHSTQKNLTSYRVVAGLSRMTWTRPIQGFGKVMSVSKKLKIVTFGMCVLL